MRSEALNFVSPVGDGITLGKWTLWREEVFDFLQDETFQPGFLTAALRREGWDFRRSERRRRTHG